MSKYADGSTPALGDRVTGIATLSGKTVTGTVTEIAPDTVNPATRAIDVPQPNNLRILPDGADPSDYSSSVVGDSVKFNKV